MKSGSMKSQPFDPADLLDDEESMAAYLSEALDTGDPAFIADALGVVARARGMSRIARDSGLSRESLYRALSPTGNPELATLLRVVGALGLRLSVTPRPPGSPG
jgi:probable addiction module antidote protein